MEESVPYHTPQRMSRPRLHPVEKTLELAEETARVMWRAYDAHLALPRNTAGWRQQASEIFGRCMACDEHLAKLRETRDHSSLQTVGE
jgi:hypothetical protein